MKTLHLLRTYSLLTLVSLFTSLNTNASLIEIAFEGKIDASFMYDNRTGETYTWDGRNYRFRMLFDSGVSSSYQFDNGRTSGIRNYGTVLDTELTFNDVEVDISGYNSGAFAQASENMSDWFHLSIELYDPILGVDFVPGVPLAGMTFFVVDELFTPLTAPNWDQIFDADITDRFVLNASVPSTSQLNPGDDFNFNATFAAGVDSDMIVRVTSVADGVTKLSPLQIPEPMSLLLFMLGGALMTLRKRG